MPDSNNDDLKGEENWIFSMRTNVEDYLSKQGIEHGEIGERPAWHIAPITSIWAIESKASPGFVGWWVTSGDHPVDYVSSEQTKHPRAALRAFCDQWNEIAEHMVRGEQHPTIALADSSEWQNLTGLLLPRIKLFQEWAADDDAWDYDESEFENS